MTDLFAVLLAGIPLLLNLGILIYVLAYLPKGKTINVFTFFVIAVMLWQLEDVLSRTLTKEELMQYWDGILSIGWLSSGALIFHFTIRFTKSGAFRISRLLIAVYALLFLFYTTYINNPTPVNFVHHEFWGWLAVPRKGSLDNVQRHYISVLAILALVMLFNYVFRQRHNEIKRKQGLLMAVGILIPTLQGTLTQVLLPAYFDMDVPLTSAFMTIFSVAVIVALKKYKLFNIADSLNVEDVLENLKNMVLIVSPDGKIIYQNSFAGEKIGKLENDGGAELDRLFPGGGSRLKEFREHVFEPALKGLQVNNYETVIKSGDDQPVHVILSSEVIRNNGVIQGILLIANDISDSKSFMKTIDEQNRRMRKISWTQSHIVRAPLARIMGLVEIINYPATNGKEREEMLGHLAEAAAELDDVIRSIVDNAQDVQAGKGPKL